MDRTDLKNRLRQYAHIGWRQFRLLFSSLEIRYKFLLSFSVIFFLSMLLSSLFIYAYVRNNIEDRIESELTNTTRMITSMVKTAVNVSTKNHLRAVAEKNLDIVKNLYDQFRQGGISESEAKVRATRVILSQSIGKSGYIYCIDSGGTVKVHPRLPLVNTNVADHEFVRQQMDSRQGYIEYDWKNPGEERTRPKALYMAYFKPWDWIISASAYRSEFIRLVNVADFRESILDLKFGERGYAFVIDRDGNAIIHPVLQDVNIFDEKELPNQFLEDMMHRKKGKSVYPWKNPGETEARPKLVMFDYIPECQWIVASSSYLDELYHPLKTLRNGIFGTSVCFLLLMLGVTFLVSRTITTPLKKLMGRLQIAMAGDYSIRMDKSANDEVGQLAEYFNQFMDQLENQIRVRHEAEQARLESQKRYFLLMEAAPDPIVNYDTQGRVIYVNPAFTRVFGWTLAECRNKKMDHFVPEDHWAETRRMIQQVISKDGIFNVETRRYDKHGQLKDVSISGASTQDRQGNLTGSIIILRDITLSKGLEKKLMSVSDRERQKIGQDLHDDLCPQLIGIAGLAAVLEEKEWGRKSGDLAGKIVEFMEDAVEKTRGLARGLCPVHLVSQGLQSALEDIILAYAYQDNIRFECRTDPCIDFPDNNIATHLYHIAREAVNNAVRHSGGTKIRIFLGRGTGEKTAVRLTISDNGRGIPEERDGHGIGLQIMEYRAKMIDAQFLVDTGTWGTKIRVHLGRNAAIDKKETDR